MPVDVDCRLEVAVVGCKIDSLSSKEDVGIVQEERPGCSFCFGLQSVPKVVFRKARSGSVVGVHGDIGERNTMY